MKDRPESPSERAGNPREPIHEPEESVLERLDMEAQRTVEDLIREGGALVDDEFLGRSQQGLRDAMAAPRRARQLPVWAAGPVAAGLVAAGLVAAGLLVFVWSSGRGWFSPDSSHRPTEEDGLVAFGVGGDERAPAEAGASGDPLTNEPPDPEPPDPEPLGHENRFAMYPEGAVQAWTEFGWTYDLPLTASFRLVLVDPERDDKEVWSEELFENVWKPGAKALAAMPDRLRWRVEVYDAGALRPEISETTAWIEE